MVCPKCGKEWESTIHHCPMEGDVAHVETPGRTAENVEGFYERLWKDFCSLQRGDAARLVTEVPDLRAEVSRLQAEVEALRRAAERVCDETDWCPVCDNHPAYHSKTCPLHRGSKEASGV